MNSQRLKSLQVRKTQLENEIKELAHTQEGVTAALHRKKAALQTVEKDMRMITDVRPVVSEHALLRYVERVLSIDLKAIEQEILSAENVAAIETLGSGKIPFRDNLMLIVKDKTVVTINPKDIPQ